MMRVAEVYELVERMRSVEVRVAMGLLSEIERVCVKERQALAWEVDRGRAALAVGDAAGRMISEVERRANEARLEQLVDLRRQRRTDFEVAQNAYSVSRVDVEQVQRVLQCATTQRELVEHRRVQAESDDRFASQQCWRQNKSGQY